LASLSSVPQLRQGREEVIAVDDDAGDEAWLATNSYE
jgi:hypothetical protein